MLALILSSSAYAAGAPPPGLLEYLGTMVESDGELIDPLALEAIVEELTVEAADSPEPEQTDATGEDAATDSPVTSMEEKP